MIEFAHDGKTYLMAFDTKQHRTKNLQKRGFIQPRKSKTKQAADPDTRRCVHCTIKEGNSPIAYGMAACSPTDKQDHKIGQQAALRRTIQISRKKENSKLDKEWATDAWQALFNSQTTDARGDRERAKKRAEKLAKTP